MRTSCRSCCAKHLAQAIVLMLEAIQGYPEHRWLAIGHMAEAADEIVAEDPDLAKQIRELRIRYMDDPGERIYLLDIIKELDLDS